MPNNLRFLILSLCLFLPTHAVHADALLDFEMEEISAAAIAGYEIEGSLFQRITDLEQARILQQLEKEKAQLDLDLDRLAAERIKLHMEIDTLSGRAEEQQMALESERARLESEQARLEKERQSLSAPVGPGTNAAPQPRPSGPETGADSISRRYSLVNIIGAGKQLQATLLDTQSGQRRNVFVGRTLDGYTIKSISLDEGVVFVKDGRTEVLNISREK
jgi:type IV pilus biogenesis protein PilP